MSSRIVGSFLLALGLLIARDAAARKRPVAAAGKPVVEVRKGTEPERPALPAARGEVGGRREAEPVAPVVSARQSAKEIVQRESHIEFDERLVQGQTAAGAIYLFQRGESEFKSLIQLPETFRERTVVPLLPRAKTSRN